VLVLGHTKCGAVTGAVKGISWSSPCLSILVDGLKVRC
jgi:carbonic anhydrase